MKSTIAKSLLIACFSFTCALAFGQYKPDPEPTPKPGPEPSAPQKQEEIIYDLVDEPAEYPGGMQALRKFISDNLKYPEKALMDSIEGKCYLKLLISETGEVKKTQVIKGVIDCPECDKEARRIMQLMPKWKPARVNGKNVSSYYRIPVTFKLPE